MKVLFVIENFPALDAGRFAITGGVEAYALAMASWLTAHHDVRIVTNRRQGPTVARLGRLEIIQCGRGGRYRQGGGIRQRRSFQREAVAHGLSFRPEVVVGWNFVSYPPAFTIAKRCGAPAIPVYHDVWIGRWIRLFGVAGVLGELLERRVLRSAWTRFIAVSDRTRDLLIAQHIPADRITVVPPSLGADVDVTKTTGKTPESDASSTRLVVVTRLVQYKRVDVVLEAFSRVAHHTPALRLEIVGTGPEESRLRAQAQRLGISDRVDWRGWVPEREEVLAAMGNALLYISASEVEGFGLAAIEAAAQGTPYVAADIPAVRFATRDGRAGLLFEPGNAEACAKAIETFLLNPRFHASKRAEARSLAATYTAEQVGPRFEAVLLEAMGKHLRA